MFDLDELSKEQVLLKKKITLTNIDINKIDTIAGVDIAYFSDNQFEYGVCCIVVFDIKTFQIIERVNSILQITFPYIPGYLSYRELPVILSAYFKLNIKPDIFMFDGNGYLHPNHMGIATMFSIKTGEASLGVAKSFFNFSKQKINLDNKHLAVMPITINNELFGYAMRSRLNCNPIFISPGNYMSFENSLDITKKCLSSESRIPIPTRIADIDTHIERNKIIVKK